MIQFNKMELVKPIIHYNDNIAEKINKLCRPLKEAFGITTFAYWHILDDGRYILLSNNQSFINLFTHNDFLFRSEHFQNHPEILNKYEDLKQFWPSIDKDVSIDMLHSENVINGFDIIKDFNGTVRSYSFATEKSNPLAPDFYTNHINVLTDFINYFHNVAGQLCDPSDLTKFGTSLHLKENYPIIEKIFKATPPWEEQIKHFNDLMNSILTDEIVGVGRPYGLSNRELQCLSYLSSGKTAKEIARILNISFRTVEAHICNLRLKTSCQTKNELINWFEEKFKHFLGKNISLL